MKKITSVHKEEIIDFAKWMSYSFTGISASTIMEIGREFLWNFSNIEIIDTKTYKDHLEQYYNLTTHKDLAIGWYLCLFGDNIESLDKNKILDESEFSFLKKEVYEYASRKCRKYISIREALQLLKEKELIDENIEKDLGYYTRSASEEELSQPMRAINALTIIQSWFVSLWGNQAEEE